MVLTEVHPPAVAVIVNVVVCETFVLLVNIPLMVAPAPLGAIPVKLPLLSLVQLKVVPGTLLGLVMVICEMADPEQTV